MWLILLFASVDYCIKLGALDSLAQPYLKLSVVRPEVNIPRPPSPSPTAHCEIFSTGRNKSASSQTRTKVHTSNKVNWHIQWHYIIDTMCEWVIENQSCVCNRSVCICFFGACACAAPSKMLPCFPYLNPLLFKSIERHSKCGEGNRDLVGLFLVYRHEWYQSLSVVNKNKQ